MPSCLRVLVADDHAVVRMGLRSLFALHTGWQVCGEAGDGDTAVAKVLQLAPDVVILDLTMPGMNGFNAAREIRRVAPSTKIILFSIHDIPSITGQAAADAFVAKTAPPTELISVIERLTCLPQPPPSSDSPVNLAG